MSVVSGDVTEESASHVFATELDVLMSREFAQEVKCENDVLKHTLQLALDKDTEKAEKKYR